MDHASKEAPTTRQNGAEPHVNLTQQEPSPEPSDEPSQGARAQGEVLGEGEDVDLGEPGSDGEAAIEAAAGRAVAAWPDSGRAKTKFERVRAVWSDEAESVT